MREKPAGMPLFTRDALCSWEEQGLQLDIGDYSYGTPQLFYRAGDKAKLTIGKFCSIGEGGKIFLGEYGRHFIDFVSSYPMVMLYGVPAGVTVEPSAMQIGNLDVTIGNDVWLGRDVTIMAGVNIGDGAVIGLGSVVTKDVPPYGVAAGSPAKTIRYRFSETLVAKLLQLRWWNWTDEELESRIAMFYKKNFEADLDAIIAKDSRAKL